MFSLECLLLNLIYSTLHVDPHSWNAPSLLPPSAGYSSPQKQTQPCLTFFFFDCEYRWRRVQHNASCFTSQQSHYNIILPLPVFSHMPNISFPRLGRRTDSTPCLLLRCRSVPSVCNETEALSGSLVKRTGISHRTVEKCRETENIAH